MKLPKPKTQLLLDFVQKAGIIRAHDARALGIHHEYLRRLCAEGQLTRIGRGLYTLPTSEATVHHSLAEVGKVIPNGVICLLSALRFHEIGTQAPHEVWVALDRKAATRRITRPRVRILRFSGKALTEGTETHNIEGVEVKIYCPAKTVADCFKYRNKIGLDVALEALQSVLRDRICSVDELWRAAKTCRVAEVMRPYMEASL